MLGKASTSFPHICELEALSAISALWDTIDAHRLAAFGSG
jgi:hypothetical protein